MGKIIEYNRVYRRIEASDRGVDNSIATQPSIEIVGDTTVCVYGSNQCRSLEEITKDKKDKYTPPISDTDIETMMTKTDFLLEPGFHKSCLCTTWIAFLPDVPADPPVIYDCGIIDWEFDDRRKANEDC